MKKTYKEWIVYFITRADRPLGAGQIIHEVQIECPQSTQGSIRQALLRGVKDGVLVMVYAKDAGARAYYSNPAWVVNGKLKKEYEAKINFWNNANQQIQVQ